MTGTPSQVEWAERIKATVQVEFERVARSLSALTDAQTDAAQAATREILAILEEKRAAVMSRQDAGYFIRDWQEISDQVRKMIVQDSRYEAIRARKAKGLRNREMNIRPLYDRIVVKRIDEQETSRNGIIIPDSAQEKPHEGEVMATGRGKRLEDGTMTELDVRVGDRVLFGKYSGSEIKVDGREYLIMREDDVLGILS